MPVNAFLARLGFSADPFESTNASEEPGLPNYFVPPPYFTSILGNIDTPKSHVILAPRGGGKTAQRLMIENDSVTSGKYLCVTYDEFDVLTSTQVTWAAHMKQICRLLLVGILVRIDREPTTVHQLSDSEKRLLKQQVSSLLGNISAEEFARSIRALKNFADHARDYWQRYGGLVASLLNAFIAKYGFDKMMCPRKWAVRPASTTPFDFNLANYFASYRRSDFNLHTSSSTVLMNYHLRPRMRNLRSLLFTRC
jgi:hypothetical protein